MSVPNVMLPEMPEAQRAECIGSCDKVTSDRIYAIADSNPQLVPDQPPTCMGAGDMGTQGHPENFVSYRVTSDDRDKVFDFFRGCKCVIAEEISSSGVKHFHVVVEGHADHETIKKRIVRAKLGVNKWWSKKNNGDFLKAVAYTIKCGEYFTRRGFGDYTEYVEKNCPWVFNPVDQSPLVCSETERDSDKDWMLTYNNLLRVAHNYARRKQIKTDDLGLVLAHMTEHTRWIPSPQMMKSGLDPWYFKMYKFRVGSVRTIPDWWTPRSI